MYKTITNLLTANKYSRPQRRMWAVKAIVIHYVANTNSTASGNRNFFENRKNGTSGYGSAHEIIDLNGDVLVCIPDDEIAYHCGSVTYSARKTRELGTENPNNMTYGIECTHIDNTGKMSEATYNTLVERCADLCIKFNLNPIKNLWTHKEIVGWKDCHLWFVNNPNEWINFKNKVNIKMNDIKVNSPIKILQIKGFIKSPEYWMENAIKGKEVNGQYVADLLMAISKTKTLKEAVSYMINKKVITNNEYWSTNSTEGKTIQGEYMQKLLIGLSKIV